MVGAGLAAQEGGVGVDDAAHDFRERRLGGAHLAKEDEHRVGPGREQADDVADQQHPPVVLVDVHERAELGDRAAGDGVGEGFEPGWPPEHHGREGDDTPAGSGDLDRFPLLVPEVEVDVLAEVGKADVHRVFVAVEDCEPLEGGDRVGDCLRLGDPRFARLEHGSQRAEQLGIRVVLGVRGGGVGGGPFPIRPRQPQLERSGPDRVDLAVTVDGQRDECGLVGGVEQERVPLLHQLHQLRGLPGGDRIVVVVFAGAEPGVDDLRRGRHLAAHRRQQPFPVPLLFELVDGRCGPGEHVHDLVNTVSSFDRGNEFVDRRRVRSEHLLDPGQRLETLRALPGAVEQLAAGRAEILTHRADLAP